MSPSLDPWHHGLPIHGGSAPQVLRKARYRQAELVALEIIRNYGGRPPVTDPITALSELAPRPWRSRTTCAARWTLCGPQEWWYKCAGQEQLRSEIVLYERSLDRCAKVLTDMTRLNLEDRLVIVTERWAEVVVSVIRSILAALGTDPDDVEGRTIVQPNLRAVGA